MYKTNLQKSSKTSVTCYMLFSGLMIRYINFPILCILNCRCKYLNSWFINCFYQCHSHTLRHICTHTNTCLQRNSWMRKCLMTNVQHKFFYGVKSKCRHDLSRLFNLQYGVNQAKVIISKCDIHVKNNIFISIDITVTDNWRQDCNRHIFRKTTKGRNKFAKYKNKANSLPIVHSNIPINIFLSTKVFSVQCKMHYIHCFRLKKKIAKGPNFSFLNTVIIYLSVFWKTVSEALHSLRFIFYCIKINKRQYKVSCFIVHLLSGCVLQKFARASLQDNKKHCRYYENNQSTDAAMFFVSNLKEIS